MGRLGFRKQPHVLGVVLQECNHWPRGRGLCHQHPNPDPGAANPHVNAARSRFLRAILGEWVWVTRFSPCLVKDSPVELGSVEKREWFEKLVLIGKGRSHQSWWVGVSGLVTLCLFKIIPVDPGWVKGREKLEEFDY